MPKVIKFLGYDPFPPPRTLAEKVRRYRLLHGLTQRQLATRLHLAADTVRSLERGLHRPGKRVHRKLLGLGIRP